MQKREGVKDTCGIRKARPGTVLKKEVWDREDRLEGKGVGGKLK